MSMSICCKAPVKYDFEPDENSPGGSREVIICQSCGEPSREYDPPCLACGSDDPCSCFDDSGEPYHPGMNDAEPDRRVIDEMLKLLEVINDPRWDQPFMVVSEEELYGTSTQVQKMLTEIKWGIDLEIQINKYADEVRFKVINKIKNTMREVPRVYRKHEAVEVLRNLKKQYQKN